MRHRVKILYLFLIISGSLSAQSFTDSNLPIILINTDGGVSIPDNPRVKGSMKIIYRGAGERNYVTDQYNTVYLNYNGRIDIEIRGSSSQSATKKQYGFTTWMTDDITKNNVSLLGMPPENDWVLNGMAYDSALIRDYMCFNLSRQLGEYASRTSYCELIINGAYRGLYLLEEKIKADDNRVNVIKIGMNDNYLPNLSGGYITKADHTIPDDPVAWTMPSWYGWDIDYIHELPKPENVTTSQHNYIHSQFTSLDETAQMYNSSLSTGFPSIIDIPSFINYIIINELSSNPDSYQVSTYFHKDRNGKLRAGPVWDLDLTFGNDLFDWGVDRSKTNVWQFSNNGSMFWKNLFDNTLFRCYLSKRWNELIQPGQPLNLASLETLIDQTVATINEAVVRNNILWGIKDYQQQIGDLKSFIAERILWITTNLGPCSSCTDVPVPLLVISKIMYHPEASTYSPDNDNFEFLEITNNSDTIVDLTGVYFGGTGFVYQFQVNSTLGPYDSVYLASDSIYFNIAYGFKPYGQFTRHLSNKSEDLVLSDAFGNVIDNVNYSDSIPWPDADGNGFYLELSDMDLDNGLASSWEASKVTFTQKAYLNVSVESTSLDCEAGSNGILNITSNTYWTIFSSETWLTLSKANGSEDAAITITAQKNPTINSREATVTVKSTGLPDRTIIITQIGSQAYLNVSTETISLGCQEGSSGSFNITSTIYWIISSSETWLTLSKASGLGDATIIVTARENPPTSTIRYDTVTIRATGLADRTVTITQASCKFYLNVSIEEMLLDCQEGSSDIINIGSNTFWTISSSAKWLTLSKVSGGGNATITVTAQNNPTINTREATVTINATGLPDKILIVNQEGSKAYLDVSIDTISLDCQEGSSGIINIGSNTFWTVSSSERWLTLSMAYGGGNATITVTAQNNPTTNTRYASVTFKATGLPDRMVTITQAGSTTSINQTEDNHVKIYPNPARTMLFIEGLSKGTQVSIYDLRGNLILKKQLLEGYLDISTLASGLYTIKLETISESIARRFMKD